MAAVQSMLRKAHPDPLMFEVMPLDEMREAQMYPLRTASWIGSLLGAIALVLSVSGLYGVLTYTLSQRTREIGIRMALGATSAAVVRMVMTQSARLAGSRRAIGLAVALRRDEGPEPPDHAAERLGPGLGAFAASLALVAVAVGAGRRTAPHAGRHASIPPRRCAPRAEALPALVAPHEIHDQV